MQFWHVSAVVLATAIVAVSVPQSECKSLKISNLHTGDYWPTWEEFKTKYNKNYNVEEDQIHRRHFNDSKLFVMVFHAYHDLIQEVPSYTVGINDWSDMGPRGRSHQSMEKVIQDETKKLNLDDTVEEEEEDFDAVVEKYNLDCTVDPVTAKLLGHLEKYIRTDEDRDIIKMHIHDLKSMFQGRGMKPGQRSKGPTRNLCLSQRKIVPRSKARTQGSRRVWNIKIDGVERHFYGSKERPFEVARRRGHQMQDRKHSESHNRDQDDQ